MYRRLLLLGLLAQEEMHGYRLHEFLDKTLGSCSDLKKSTAYFLLDKLAQEGYVAVSSDRAGHYPERRVYALTPAGREYFLELLRDNLAVFQRVYYPGDVGLAFAHALDPAERTRLLQKRRQHLGEALAAMQAAPPHGGSLGLVIERNVALLAAELAWLEGALSQVADVDGLGAPQTAPGGKKGKRTEEGLV